MPEIRVTYSGLISLLIGTITIVTGLLFSMILTRSLNPSEFGIWNLINSMIGYVIIVEPLISYWTTREVSRGIGSPKTSIFSSGLFSLGGIVLYSVISHFMRGQSSVDYSILAMGIMLIPVMFLNNTLSAINLGWKPHLVSYGTLAYGITQILMGIIFIYFLKMGISGVIISVTLGYCSSIAVLGFYAKDKLKGNIKKEFLQKWLKISWIPLYPNLSSLLTSSYVVIFILITRSVETVGFWSAALVVSSVIGNSSLISKAIYPKLLGSKRDDFLQNNLTQLFYFTIPITAMVIAFAKPALIILNPLYESVIPVVIITAIMAFFNALSTSFQSYLLGAEKVDLDKNSTFKDFAMSKLFRIPSIMLIQSISYVTLFAIGLSLLKSNSQLELLIFWASVALITQIPVSLYFYHLVKKNFVIKLDFTSIAKYLTVSLLVFGIAYYCSEKFTIYETNLFALIPRLLLLMGLGGTSYILITWMIDNKTKQLLAAIMNEIKRKF